MPARSPPELAERGFSLPDAPVTGSSPRLQDGTLTFMVGGSRTRTSTRAQPLLEAMGELIVYAGPHGHGQIVKLINNAVAATNATVRRPGATGRLARRPPTSRCSSPVMWAGAGGLTMLA